MSVDYYLCCWECKQKVNIAERDYLIKPNEDWMRNILAAHTSPAVAERYEQHYCDGKLTILSDVGDLPDDPRITILREVYGNRNIKTEIEKEK